MTPFCLPRNRQAGADAAAPSEMRNGRTAMHALRNGMESLIPLLCQGGLDVNTSDSNGDTALAVACESGAQWVLPHISCVAALWPSMAPCVRGTPGR